MIWNESIECMDRESLRKIQSIRLKKTVERVYHDTPFYRKKMQELGVTPDDINSIDDIVKTAFYYQVRLAGQLSLRPLCRTYEQIVRIHASSGTTGKPTVVAIPEKTFQHGPNAFHGPLPPMVPVARIFSRCPTVTDFLPADWVRMPVPRISALPSSRCPAAIRRSRLH